MNEVIKRKEGAYCPITVSDMATSNAKVRQTSLREYLHAQDSAYRAFCRGPGRPQTAAFGRVYFESLRNRQSVSPRPDTANLRDCVVASRVTVEERSNDAANHSAVNAFSRSINQSTYTKRQLSSRTKTARKTLQRLAEELNDIAASTAGSKQPLEDTVCIKNEETDDFMIELGSNSNEKKFDVEINDEINKTTPCEDFDRRLTVYHFVDGGCPCTTAVNYHCDPAVSCRACSCEQQFLVSSYAVEMQGEGYASTPGLRNCDAQENKALWDLLQKQLSLSRSQHCTDDRNQQQQLDSLNALIAKLVNVKPPKGYLYYFAYGPDINTKRFVTFIHRKLEDTAWALLYGFKLTSPDEQGLSFISFRNYKNGHVWLKCKYSPQSAVEGRLYLISKQEADMLDEQLDDKRMGLLPVLLPVWLIDNDENACSTAQYCLPALVHLLPHQLLS